VLFDGGVRFDPKDQLFNMWHSCGFRDGICYATSKDGIHWDRPNLDVSPRENRVLPYQKGWALSGFFVALDDETKDPAQRFKMLADHRYPGQENPCLVLALSDRAPNERLVGSLSPQLHPLDLFTIHRPKLYPPLGGAGISTGGGGYP
jgi:hypothetical protein